MPDRTPVGAERSGALGGFAESCACGLSWHNRPAEGKLNQMYLGVLEEDANIQKRVRMNTEVDANEDC